MKNNVIKEKSFAFAVRIVHLCKHLTKPPHKEFIISKQLFKSGTAIGALYHEAEYAESKADFIHKMAIAQKECNETIYWLELLQATDYLTKKEFKSIYSDAVSLIKLITSILKTAKKNR